MALMLGMCLVECSVVKLEMKMVKSSVALMVVKMGEWKDMRKVVCWDREMVGC